MLYRALKKDRVFIKMRGTWSIFISLNRTHVRWRGKMADKLIISVLRSFCVSDSRRTWPQHELLFSSSSSSPSPPPHRRTKQCRRCSRIKPSAPSMWRSLYSRRLAFPSWTNSTSWTCTTFCDSRSPPDEKPRRRYDGSESGQHAGHGEKVANEHFTETLIKTEAEFTHMTFTAFHLRSSRHWILSD